MELKEYIAGTLKQLIDGVADAQEYAKSKGAAINPAGLLMRSGQLEIAHALDGVYTDIPQVVEFDIAVTVSEGGEAKAGVGVFAVVGAHATTQDSNVQVNKIAFSVPIMFPKQTT